MLVCPRVHLSSPVKQIFPLLLTLLVLATACSRPEPKRAANATPAPAQAVVDDRVRVDCTALISSLIDPAKLDTLKGDRAANGRLRKIAYWLEFARRQGDDVAELIGNAQAHAGYGGTARAHEDRKAILRNLTILERLGCLTDEGLAKLRKGNAPTITRGPYAGDIASVDHIIPRSVTPELDEKLFNLEFMPSKMNTRKGDTIGQRQRALAENWARDGLLSATGATAVKHAEK